MAKRAKSKAAPDWLQALTGKAGPWWIDRVQTLIGKHSRRTKDPKHDRTDPRKWLGDLTQEVVRRAPKRGRYDENMRTACILAMVLSLWYTRVHRAKIYDPRRPVELRKQAYFTRQVFTEAMFHIMTDESQDPTYFPGQQWETPFHPYPTDGVFV